MEAPEKSGFLLSSHPWRLPVVLGHGASKIRRKIARKRTPDVGHARRRGGALVGKVRGISRRRNRSESQDLAKVGAVESSGQRTQAQTPDLDASSAPPVKADPAVREEAGACQALGPGSCQAKQERQVREGIR